MSHPPDQDDIPHLPVRQRGSPLLVAAAIGTVVFLIVAVDPASGASAPLLDCVRACSSSGSLAASPSGASIAYGETGAAASIGIAEVATGQSRVIAACPSAAPCNAGYSIDLSWSPTGHWIAVETVAGIWIVGIGGELPTLIAAHGRDPTVSPDGMRVMYVTTTGVETVGVDGTDRQSLGFKGAEWAAWSPDGARIAYLTEVAGEAQADGDHFTAQLWVADLDGRRALKIHQFPGCCLGAWIGPPVWSPDGRLLAVAGGTGASKLTIVAADGSSKVAVAIDLEGRAVPTWLIRPAPTRGGGSDPTR